MSPYEQAQQALSMTPQEQGLYERHLANLHGPGGVRNADGSISTLYQMGAQGPDGQQYNIPSVYNGKILPPEQAIRNAAQQGWHTFPSYATPDEAEARYQQMHGFMDQDVGQYLAQQKVRDALMNQGPR
jgi:hypothetical protein